MPSGGLYATYHLLREPETTIDSRQVSEWLPRSFSCVHHFFRKPHAGLQRGSKREGRREGAQLYSLLSNIPPLLGISSLKLTF